MVVNRLYCFYQAKSPFERNSRGQRKTIMQPHPDYAVNVSLNGRDEMFI